ncbi:hypothetical protein F5141DRAFT_1065279 [Pisolithus sp. B1]|nr:hypothetical protein F5141DRAFT_1065279 [Pisolithus sp. B1]
MQNAFLVIRTVFFVFAGWNLSATGNNASSINVTVNGPPIICHSQWTWSTCASSSLLVPVTWMVTLIISSVPWFNVDAKVPSPTTEVFAKDSPTTKAFSRVSNASMESCAVTKYITERWGRLTHVEGQPECTSKLAFSKGHQSTDNARPVWVQQRDRQRGVDQPFANPPPLPALRGVLPPPPPTILAKEAVVPRDARYVGRSEMKWGDGYSTLNSNAKTLPKGTAHPDHPIALPHLSQRIRADGTKAGYF